MKMRFIGIDLFRGGSQRNPTTQVKRKIITEILALVDGLPITNRTPTQTNVTNISKQYGDTLSDNDINELYVKMRDDLPKFIRTVQPQTVNQKKLIELVKKYFN